jgi:hypothetical protein
MEGLIAVLLHVITIGLVWLSVIVSSRIAAWAFMRSATSILGADHPDIKRANETKNKIIKVADIGSTAIALIAIVITMLFLTNPFARSHEEIRTITPATTEDFIVPSNTQDKEAIDDHHRKQRNIAVEENQEAMDKAMKMFQKTIENVEEKENE